MPEPQKPFYLTTPIYYVNARPHIGHAYTTIVADVLARRHRLLGDDTFFLTGTDEHGQKIERSALAAGMPPQEFTDQVSAEFRNLWDRMGLTYDRFIRTTDAKHKQGVQKLFAELYKNGKIYLDSYTGAYCVSDEAFVDAPIGTPCPDCGRLLEEVTEENFFFKLSEYQLPLLDLIESDTLRVEPESRKNEVLSFLRGNLSAAFYSQGAKQELLREPRDTSDTAVRAKLGRDVEAEIIQSWPHRSKLGNSYVPGALRDLSVSRSSFTWGIPVPEPAASASQQKHVIYVWLDALANYMTAMGYGSDDPKDRAEFEKYWPADLHLVGKEIIRFHCVYWPAFLMAAGLPLPKAVTAHGWLLFDNSKMSKSKGNIVRTETILEAFGTLCPPSTSQPHANSVILSEGAEHNPKSVILSEGAGPHPAPQSKDLHDTKTSITAGTLSTENPSRRERDLFASDVLRYFLLREIPFGQDGSFSFDAMVTRYNADLANGYGNLVSRTLTMLQKYRGGAVTPIFYSDKLGALAINLPELLNSYDALIAGNEFTRALEQIHGLIKIVDVYVSVQSPWRLAKADVGRDAEIISEVLYVAAETVRIVTALLYPILPYATAAVWRQLGLGSIEAAAANGELKNLQWGGLKPGTKLGPLAPIFPRADKGLAQIMIDMENPTPTPTEADTTNPAAAPRNADANEPATTLPVAGSTATTTHTGPTPSHTEVPASGIFAAAPPSGPLALDPGPSISIDDFIKVELRVAEITLAERIPKADKLLRLEVSLGDALPPRQILSGIAEHYTPEELIGRRIIVITNLAPRKMRGLESHGMLLAASEEGGKPYLATVPEGVPLGTRLK
jgi:methionyl-tRNA synthetase